jgi:hypothetical protein
MRKEEHIPFIHNYCDRWCEKCAFTAQCRVYVKEMRLTDEQKDMDNEAFWTNMQHNLLTALDGLKKIALEQGISLEEGSPDNEETEIEEVVLTPEQVALENESRRYITVTDQWFKAKMSLFEEKQKLLISHYEMGMDIDRRVVYRLNDALEAIKWYQYFISAKVHRSLHGLDWVDIEGIDPVQNDSNGSAKIALIAIDNSINAWETIRNAFPEETDGILDVMLLLNKLRRGLLDIFPQAENFKRPGFDDMY